MEARSRNIPQSQIGVFSGFHRACAARALLLKIIIEQGIVSAQAKEHQNTPVNVKILKVSPQRVDRMPSVVDQAAKTPAYAEIAASGIRFNGLITGVEKRCDRLAGQTQSIFEFN
ncbi:MAG: hypothetical protein ACREUA_05565 [Burkholderiales bacterium]